MQSNEEEKKFTLSRLTEMFSANTQEYIRNVCEQFNWNVENCVDHLIKTNEINKQKTDSQNSPQRILNTSQFQISGAIPKISVLNNQAPLFYPKNKIRRSDNEIIQTEEERIVEQIKLGFRVMVLMRGAPGCGKSHLSRSIVQQCMLENQNYDFKDFIFSSDDYFYDAAGNYKHDVQRLDEVHSANFAAVKEKAASGFSPIIVDNTNIKLWEMMRYVELAVQCGYIVEVMEPNTPWRYSAGKLALKNSHGVPREKIQLMLNRFETGTAADLIGMLKNTKYTVPLPQMRLQPPIPTPQQDIKTEEKFQIFNTESHDPKENLQIEPKPQRQSFKERSNEDVSSQENFEQNNNKPIQDQLNVWQYFQNQAHDFVDVMPQNSKENKIIPNTKQNLSKVDKTLMDLLKEGFDEVKNDNSSEALKKDSIADFQRHAVNCPNEHKSFSSLRQIYPNKSISGLWDLFIKCNGDIDWAVDILLKEDELSLLNDDVSAHAEEKCVEFTCNCNNSMNILENVPLLENTEITLLSSVTKPQRLKVRTSRGTKHTNNDHQDMKETIENCFVIGDEHYSPHIRKIRDIRNGILDLPSAEFLDPQKKQQLADSETQTEIVEEDEEDEGTDIIEVTLGDNLIGQLKEIFKTETPLGEKLPEKTITNVFLPRSLAKELYMLWMESVYNHLEEERQQALRDDEQFARLITNPKYENFKNSPNNAQELLDMEMSWTIYKSDLQDDKLEQMRHHPTNLAEHLTQMKLIENFPNIPRETLLDVLAANNHKYNDTVELLRDNMQTDEIKNPTMTHAQLLECVERENELLTYRSNAELKQQTQIQGQQVDGSSHSSESVSNFERASKSSVSPEEAKRLALHDFEETRNLAAHHCQLKAECYQKAKEAIHKGNNGVALYYSQIANFHKQKIDMYNHRAANCIIEVHKYTQNNPDLLDLHYLHVIEAIGCLDLFLDRHITGLRSTSRTYKHVFIITGRGLHSAGGISTIKNRVKTRLKERNLRWSEVNPGLLKVKMFSASRHSKNF